MKLVIEIEVGPGGCDPRPSAIYTVRPEGGTFSTGGTVGTCDTESAAWEKALAAARAAAVRIIRASGVEGVR